MLASCCLTIKEEELLSVKAMYEGEDMFVRLLTWFGKSLCYQVLPLLFNYNLSLIGFGKSSTVPLVFLLVSLMVDQFQRL